MSPLDRERALVSVAPYFQDFAMKSFTRCMTCILFVVIKVLHSINFSHVTNWRIARSKIHQNFPE